MSKLENFARLFNGIPIICIDAGARGGMPRIWKNFSPYIDLSAFEPDAEACKIQAALASQQEHWFPTALAEHSGVGKVYVVRKASSSSMFPPNPAMSAHYDFGRQRELDREVEIPCLSLSEFLATHERPLPNLIKLDTQGMELPILRGLAPQDWRDLIAIQTEFTFIERYIGEPMFHELDSFIRSQGFVLYDLLPVRKYRTGGIQRHHFLRKHLAIVRNRRDLSARVVAGDAFYMRPLDQVLASKDKAMAAKAVAILVMYRFLDEALWFVEAAVAASLFSPAEGEAALALVKELAPHGLPWHRTGKIGKWSRRFLKWTGISKRRQVDYWMDRSWDN